MIECQDFRHTIAKIIILYEKFNPITKKQEIVGYRYEFMVGKTTYKGTTNATNVLNTGVVKLWSVQKNDNNDKILVDGGYYKDTNTIEIGQTINILYNPNLPFESYEILYIPSNRILIKDFSKTPQRIKPEVIPGWLICSFMVLGIILASIVNILCVYYLTDTNNILIAIKLSIIILLSTIIFFINSSKCKSKKREYILRNKVRLKAKVGHTLFIRTKLIGFHNSFRYELIKCTVFNIDYDNKKYFIISNIKNEISYNERDEIYVIYDPDKNQILDIVDN